MRDDGGWATLQVAVVQQSRQLSTCLHKASRLGIKVQTNLTKEHTSGNASSRITS